MSQVNLGVLPRPENSWGPLAALQPLWRATRAGLDHWRTGLLLAGTSAVCLIAATEGFRAAPWDGSGLGLLRGLALLPGILLVVAYTLLGQRRRELPAGELAARVVGTSRGRRRVAALALLWSALYGVSLWSGGALSDLLEGLLLVGAAHAVWTLLLVFTAAETLTSDVPLSTVLGRAVLVALRRPVGFALHALAGAVLYLLVRTSLELGVSWTGVTVAGASPGELLVFLPMLAVHMAAANWLLGAAVLWYLQDPPLTPPPAPGEPAPDPAG